MKVNFLFQAFLILLFGTECNRPESYTLSECNGSVVNGYIPKVDTEYISVGNNYCFEIRHDKVRDLSPYRLGIEINGKDVYWGRYKERVTCRFNKRSSLNSLVIFLFDSVGNKIYSWENKEDYDFDSAEIGCRRVKLYSDKNKDYSNSIEMEVN
jgi:hypothetical protein